jgi:hypothetical protein
MKKNNEMIDGISVTTWKEIEKISMQYPKPIRYAEGTVAKLTILKFYLEPLMKDERPPMDMMEPGRMITIAYRFYKESNVENIKELALTLINKFIR